MRLAPRRPIRHTYLHCIAYRNQRRHAPWFVFSRSIVFAALWYAAQYNACGEVFCITRESGWMHRTAARQARHTTHKRARAQSESHIRRNGGNYTVCTEARNVCCATLAKTCACVVRVAFMHVYMQYNSKLHTRFSFGRSTSSAAAADAAMPHDAHTVICVCVRVRACVCVCATGATAFPGVVCQRLRLLHTEHWRPCAARFACVFDST